MKVAVIDVGTNSVRLLLAHVDESGVAESERRTAVTRLGQGVDERRRLAPEAVERTRRCVAEYAAAIGAFGADRRLLIATSAVRDAGGGHFLSELELELGLPSRVLEGAEEAALSFAGAASAAPFGFDGGASSACHAAGDLLVVDIGGGSTEFAVGPVQAVGQRRTAAVASRILAAPPRPRFARSLDVGCVRLTERFFASDPPLDDEWHAACDFLRAIFARELAETGALPVSSGIGVAGTITTLVAHKLRMREYDASLVHGHFLSYRDIEAAIARFRALTHAERAALPGIQAGREDVVLAGALIAREACGLFSLDGLTASEADILDGVAAALAVGDL